MPPKSGQLFPEGLPIYPDRHYTVDSLELNADNQGRRWRQPGIVRCVEAIYHISRPQLSPHFSPYPYLSLLPWIVFLLLNKHCLGFSFWRRLFDGGRLASGKIGLWLTVTYLQPILVGSLACHDPESSVQLDNRAQSRISTTCQLLVGPVRSRLETS